MQLNKGWNYGEQMEVEKFWKLLVADKVSVLTFFFIYLLQSNT
jgi:hypothetical protein